MENQDNNATIKWEPLRGILDAIASGDIHGGIRTYRQNEQELSRLTPDEIQDVKGSIVEKLKQSGIKINVPILTHPNDPAENIRTVYSDPDLVIKLYEDVC